MTLSDITKDSALQDLAESVVKAAENCGKTIVTAESCTAGAIAHLLSQAPGAGDHFHGGFVTYTKDMKQQVLGVSADLLRDNGAVCAEVAVAMAAGALSASPAGLAIAVTGVAGPDPDEDGNPVGLIYIAAADRAGKQHCDKHMFGKRDSDEILRRAVEAALILLREFCRR
jgi:nicotinamide-nucleotide amidase